MGFEDVFLAWAGSIFISLIPTMLLFVPRSNGSIVPESIDYFGGMKNLWKPNIANFIVSVVMNFPLAIGSLIALSKWGAVDAGRFYIFWMIGAVGMIAPVSFSSTALVEAKEMDSNQILLNYRHLAFCIFSAILVSMAGIVALPLFGDMFLPSDWIAIIPFAASSIPGYFFYSQLSYFRFREILLPLVLMGCGLVSTFLVGIVMLPIGVEETGMIFLFTITLFSAMGWLTSNSYLRRDVVND